MNGHVVIKRLPTGVPGLDDVLGGGLPELSFNIIAGAPGCGKTTLAHQMMFAMASPENRALYITVLGEPPLKMMRYQQQFGFFAEDALPNAVRFVNVADTVATGDLDALLQQIAREVDAYSPRFVFVDSFRSVMLAGSEGAPSRGTLQQFVQQLGMLMTSWHATTFLIGEYADDVDANPVFTVADGVLWLRQSLQRNSMVRKIEVVKMRGQETLPGLHAFRIRPSGIEVFANAPLPLIPNKPFAPISARLLMGIPGCDEMLGGGLPQGYSLLIAGPSGSGKSVMAAAFLAEGARCGETGVLAAFEQHPSRSRNRVLADLIANGSVALVDTRAPDLSIEEVLLLILRSAHALKATRVVIDSLSGFELALAPTFREDFRESLSRLVTTLANAGLTVLMTSELEDRYTDLRFSPYGTAFLTDAIIVHRYIELDSRLRRVLAVVKVRASAHSNELREYTITERGLQIGSMLLEHDGLLGGHPTHSHAAQPADHHEAPPLDG